MCPPPPTPHYHLGRPRMCAKTFFLFPAVPISSQLLTIMCSAEVKVPDAFGSFRECARSYFMPGRHDHVGEAFSCIYAGELIHIREVFHVSADISYFNGSTHLRATVDAGGGAFRVGDGVKGSPKKHTHSFPPAPLESVRAKRFMYSRKHKTHSPCRRRHRRLPMLGTSQHQSPPNRPRCLLPTYLFPLLRFRLSCPG